MGRGAGELSAAAYDAVFHSDYRGESAVLSAHAGAMADDRSQLAGQHAGRAARDRLDDESVDGGGRKA